MYSVSDYVRMIADEGRMRPYVAALREAVEPGSVVLDIGAGTGIFALLACQFGARRVFAIEPNDALQVARSAAAANGYTDRIEFLQQLSTKVTLPEQADVIVSDLRGSLPLCGSHISAVADARRRFLAPNGILIPQEDALWVEVVESPEYSRKCLAPCSGDTFGLDISAATPYVVNTDRQGEFEGEDPLVEPVSWARIDYSQVESSNVAGDAELIATRNGTAHGLSLWFVATLTPGIGFSSKSAEVYGSRFLPLLKPVSVSTGDRFHISLRANRIEDEYIWQWKTRVRGHDNSTEDKVVFNQSTFFGVPLSSQVKKQAVDYAPTLDKKGEIDRAILNLMDGEASVELIAQQILKQFSADVADLKQALARVSTLSRKYSVDP